MNTGSAQWSEHSLADAPRSDDGFALCFACSRLGHCRLGLVTETLGDDGIVVTELVCDRENEGGPEVAHGGWTAGALDELVGHTTLLRGEFAVTGTLEVRFIKPVPIGWPLIGRASIERREGRKVFATATIELADGGVVLARAQGILVKRDNDHFSRHQAWLAGQGTVGVDRVDDRAQG